MNRNQVYVTAALLAGTFSTINAQQNVDIPQLIEQLVFHHPKASDTPLYAPMVRGKDNDPEYKKQYDKCQHAFRKLTQLGEAAFPFLIAHLDDKRPSIHFRNHVLGHSVGNACFWNIYFQLTDHPENYSSYGYERKGRDGKSHTKPYSDDSPFDDAGGLKAWIEQNSALSYRRKQIKCLTWLLDREKAIGACDAESYFENILPLEIRILERKQESGEDVAKELARLRKVLEGKLTKEIPPELLPDKPSEEK